MQAFILYSCCIVSLYMQCTNGFKWMEAALNDSLQLYSSGSIAPARISGSSGSAPGLSGFIMRIYIAEFVDFVPVSTESGLPS